jgi:hypothetical protein
MNNPFDIIKAFHSKEWEKVNDREKSKNFFMINRLCAISYPLHANSFNHIKIQSEKAVDFWKVLLFHQHKKTPQFIWTKTNKTEKDKKSKEYKEETIEFIKEKYLISNREIKELQSFFPRDFDIFYSGIENILG